MESMVPKHLYKPESGCYKMLREVKVSFQAIRVMLWASKKVYIPTMSILPETYISIISVRVLQRNRTNSMCFIIWRERKRLIYFKKLADVIWGTCLTFAV